MAAYYNEHDKFAAQWLRNLIAAGHIADGVVDERDIQDVQPEDVKDFTQCHFFAGIGGWSLSLRVAGWPDERPVWTGSVPCQPFSAAGNQLGDQDERHLWPEQRRLIAECRPATFFGEQVTGVPNWLRLVRGNLEELAYSVGAVPIEAACAGGDHFRDRYWYVAHDDQQFTGQTWAERGRQQLRAGCNSQNHSGALADNQSQRGDRSAGSTEPSGRGSAQDDGHEYVVNDPSLGWGERWTEHEFRSRGFTAAVASIDGRQYVECPDGKWRRLPPPRVRWLGTGIPARVAKLRAFGNAIDHRPAAEFIRAYTEVICEL